jgi:SNF2 family DNA or RNA helicase
MVLAVILQEKAERLAQTDMVLLDAPTTTLVVVKLSLVRQWEQEIKTKTNLSVYVYHDCAGSGTVRKTQPADLASVDIVLTTYAVLQGEIKRKQPALLQFPWLRVVLDEVSAGLTVRRTTRHLHPLTNKTPLLNLGLKGS